MDYFYFDDFKEMYGMRLSNEMLALYSFTFKKFLWQWTIIAERNDFSLDDLEEECMTELEVIKEVSSKPFIVFYNTREIEKGDIYYDARLDNHYIDLFLIKIGSHNKIDTFVNQYSKLDKIKAFI